MTQTPPPVRPRSASSDMLTLLVYLAVIAAIAAGAVVVVLA